ncbi:DUF6789 family protein [Mesorhizobium sp. M0913]|uniref:DUF6789 family protein n=1 Tax=Mesorhizobium sp. M0913 TaxID=2957026 RepID=UPI00333668F4
MTNRARAGLWAGLIIALATTAFLLAGRFMLPEGMDLRHMALFVDPAKHSRLALAIGALNHILAGSVIGLLYGQLAPRFTPMTGIAALMISWAALMLVGLPLTGRSPFGIEDGVSLAVWTLALHIAFGAALGVLANLTLARLARPNY